MLEVAVVHVLP